MVPLIAEFPHAAIAIDPSRKGGLGYYQTMCFKIYVTNNNGIEMEVGDGGDVPWTQRLLSDAKERLIISAIAQERLAAMRSPR